MLRALWQFLFPSYLHSQYETVRYAFPMVLVAALITSAASLISSNQSFVTISTDVQSVARDQIFFIDVAISAHVPINAIDLQLAYSEDTIAIEGIDIGRSVITLWTEEPYEDDGVVYLRGGTFRKGFVGEHEIARIRARALAPGEAQLFVQSSNFVAGDGRGTPVPAASDPEKNAVTIAIAAVDGVAVGEAVVSVVTDTNGDGTVNLEDIAVFMSAWFTKTQVYDFDQDGRMTFKDFSILLAESFIR